MRSFYHLLVLISSGLLLTNIYQVPAQTVLHERKVNSFENIVISATENTFIHVSHDRLHKIIVKADGRVVHKVRTTVTGDTLNVHLLDPEEIGNARIEIFIKSPKVRRVIMVGSGEVNVIDGFNPNQLQALTSYICPQCS